MLKLQDLVLLSFSLVAFDLSTEEENCCVRARASRSNAKRKFAGSARRRAQSNFRVPERGPWLACSILQACDVLLKVASKSFSVPR